MKFWTSLLLACGMMVPTSIFADDACHLDVPFGPVSFEHATVNQALETILKTTGISLVETTEGNTGRITADNVQGSVSSAIARLEEGTGVHIACRQDVLRVEHRPGASGRTVPAGSMTEQSVGNMPADRGARIHAPVVVPVQVDSQRQATSQMPELFSLQIEAGDSIRSRLYAFAQQHGYIVSWSGPDVMARQTAVFAGKEVTDVFDRLLAAARIEGYLSDDEGKVLNVYVAR